jgi:hypothetical protein
MRYALYPSLLASFGIGFCILFAFIGTFSYVNFVLVWDPLSLGPMSTCTKMSAVLTAARCESWLAVPIVPTTTSCNKTSCDEIRRSTANR